MTVDTAEDWIAYDEGNRLKPYQDSRGIWTVGIGHNLEANGLPAGIVSPDAMSYPAALTFLQKRGGLNQAECDELFDSDCYIAETALARLVPWVRELGYSSARYAALLNMIFNMGETKMVEFKNFLGFMAAGKFDDAANDLRQTLVFRQLPKRYCRIADTIETGNWPVLP